MRAVLGLALAAVLAFPASAAAEPKTGQSPDCERFCMSVEPSEGPEGSVFRIRGRGWRPGRVVEVVHGVYCRPDVACVAIAYFTRLRADRRGRFTFRVRAGQTQPGDDEQGITSGSGFMFAQWLGKPNESHRVQRRPRYQVILPPECDCG